MRTLILHAGLPKCGSSSIQRSLYAGRKTLAGRGVVYWNIGANHSEPLKALSERYFRRQFGPGRQAALGSSEAIGRSLRRTLAGKAEFVIISAEGMGKLRRRDATPSPDDPLGRLAAAVAAGGFDEVRLIAYIRPPIPWYESLVQQRTKGGTTARALARGASYRGLLEPLLAAFPGAVAVLRPFVPAEFRGGSLLADFLHAAGIPADRAEGVAEVRANPSLSAEATAFLDRMHRVAGPEARFGIWFVEHYLRPRLSGGGRFRLPPDTLAAMLEANRDDIAWMSARLGRDLLPPPGAIPAATEAMPDEALLDGLAGLVAQLAQDLARARSETALVAAQAAAARGDGAAARDHARAALHHWRDNPQAAALLDEGRR